jgi:hypothetical protein
MRTPPVWLLERTVEVFPDFDKAQADGEPPTLPVKDSHTEIVPTSYGELRAVLPRAGRAVGF